MDITQTFYDNLAPHYDKLFLDWQATTKEQAMLLHQLFAQHGFDQSATVLDCACGIGTQAIGLAGLGYHMTASDISDGELAEAKAIEAVMKAMSEEETDQVLAVIREAENEGSELAAILLALYNNGSDNMTEKEECLIRVAQRFPFFNLLLGDLCIDNYNETEDFCHVKKALEYYYKADAYGMLTPKYASKLCGMYDYYGQKGLLEYETQEIERLEILAKRSNYK